MSICDAGNTPGFCLLPLSFFPSRGEKADPVGELEGEAVCGSFSLGPGLPLDSRWFSVLLPTLSPELGPAWAGTYTCMFCTALQVYVLFTDEDCCCW